MWELGQESEDELWRHNLRRAHAQHLERHATGSLKALHKMSHKSMVCERNIHALQLAEPPELGRTPYCFACSPCVPETNPAQQGAAACKKLWHAGTSLPIEEVLDPDVFELWTVSEEKEDVLTGLDAQPKCFELEGFLQQIYWLLEFLQEYPVLGVSFDHVLVAVKVLMRKRLASDSITMNENITLDSEIELLDRVMADM